MGFSISIAVCDDEPPFLNMLLNHLDDYNWGYAEATIDTYSSGASIIREVESGKKYDIVFIDIELRDSMGYDVGISLKALLPETLLIYVSSYSKYTVDLLKAEPFYYLKKPVFPVELYMALDRGVARLRYIKNDYVYTYRSKGVEHIVNLQEVLFFSSEHRIINIHKVDKISNYYGRLDKTQKEISEICNFFLRPNKSFLVNSHRIDDITRTRLVVAGDEISISDKYKHDFFLAYGALI